MYKNIETKYKFLVIDVSSSGSLGVVSQHYKKERVGKFLVQEEKRLKGAWREWVVVEVPENKSLIAIRDPSTLKVYAYDSKANELETTDYRTAIHIGI